MITNLQIVNFLKNNNLAKAERQPLKGDASVRCYERIIEQGGKTYMLMKCPPQQISLQPFITVTKLLRAAGLNAPQIYDYDNPQGLMLLEDFGDNLYSAHLVANPDDELDLYKKAVDVLVQLNTKSFSDLPQYNNALLKQEVDLFFEWYCPHNNIDITHAQRAEFEELMNKLYNNLQLPQTLVMRDYHADNLIYLPEHDGVEQVGLLDYQDAVLGSPTYDLVSLLEDCRRDVSTDVVTKYLDYFITQSQLDATQVRLEYAILGLQRNLKILGIFYRLAKRDGKQHYLDYIPKVEQLVRRDLQAGGLEDVNRWFSNTSTLSKT